MTSRKPIPLDLLTTSQVLTLYEKFFGRLDATGRRRIIQRALDNGWDRAWDDDRLVA